MKSAAEYGCRSTRYTQKWFASPLSWSETTDVRHIHLSVSRKRTRSLHYRNSFRCDSYSRRCQLRLVQLDKHDSYTASHDPNETIPRPLDDVQAVPYVRQSQSAFHLGSPPSPNRSHVGRTDQARLPGRATPRRSAGSNVSCKNMTSIEKRNMVAKLASLCKIGARGQPAKIPKIMDKMRLITVSTAQRNFCPNDLLTLFSQTQHLLKTFDTRELIRCQPNSFMKDLDKTPRTEARLLNNLGNGLSSRKFSEREGQCGPPEQRSSCSRQGRRRLNTVR